MTNDELIESLIDQNKQLDFDNKKLRRANSKLKNKVRQLGRVIHELKKSGNGKQHYRNGQKRGRTQNG